jgi:hypothetical protein
MPKIIGIKPHRQQPYTPENTAVETTDAKTEETTEQKTEPTIESIEEFFIEQGNLIEAQLKAEDAYPGCPVCSRGKGILESLKRILESSLRTLDSERDAEKDATGDGEAKQDIRINSLNRLKNDLAWYDLARTALGNMFQAGHATRNVMSAHPDLAVSKTQKRQIRSGKHRKQIAKASKRKNRH